jgi:ABC-2 type transport system permease protein
MSPVTHAVRLGLSRGWTEARQSLTSAQDIGFTVFFSVVVVAVLFFQRGRTIEGTTLSLAMATLPSVLGMMIAMGAFTGTAGALTMEREDGTLLRAKAIPNGMVGYVVSRMLSVSATAVLGLVIILVPGLFMVPELLTAGLSGWLTLVWVTALGLLATLPWGVIIGSQAKSPNSLFGLAMLPVMILTSISGIFYPISAMPGWVQAVAQGFPIYWLGLGVRSAFLPDAAAAVEIAGSWRHLETIAVLGAWALAGLAVAPPILRAMARRESGSDMEQRRQQALQRYG